MEVMEMYSSLSAVGEVTLIVILSLVKLDQVIDGTGTPLAVQLKVTTSPSSPLTAVSLVGSVTSTGAEN